MRVICPNCGEQNSLRREKSAEELLEGVESDNR